MDFKQLLEQEQNKLIESRNRFGSNIIIFGESHFNFSEVKRIREGIISFNPDVIVHELWWEERDFYKQYLPDVEVRPLESIKQTFSKDEIIKDQFTKREDDMIRNLDQIVNKYERIAIVVGDTHLRSSKTKELGRSSPLISWARKNNAIIIRSDYKEIE